MALYNSHLLSKIAQWKLSRISGGQQLVLFFEKAIARTRLTF